MGITFIAPQGTYTAPAKLIEKTITDNGSYSAIDDNANGYSSVTVNVGGGGGGSSDFTTAQVTIIASSEATVAFPYIIDGEGMSLLITDRYISEGVYSVPLYKGSLGLTFRNFSTLSITGNAVDLGGGQVLVNGDCTITIS